MRTVPPVIVRALVATIKAPAKTIPAHTQGAPQRASTPPPRDRSILMASRQAA